MMKRLYIINAALFLIGIASANAESVYVYKVMPRVQDLHTYPCQRCHKTFKPGRMEREMQAPHADFVFKHMEEVRKCTFCHSSSSPNQLNLLDGTLISYNEIYRLCGQCHGKVKYNWEHGMHGSLAGHWDGERTIFNCSICHNPHSPKFEPMEPKPNEYTPKYLIHKGED